MGNSQMGKILKSMQKLSGKGITQLSDETGLSVDTINNFFYARVQKPGFTDIVLLVESMGFTVAQLVYFMNNPEVSDTDIETIKSMIAESIHNSSDETSLPAPSKKEQNKTLSSYESKDSVLTVYEKTIERQSEVIRFLRRTHIITEIFIISVLILLLLILIIDIKNNQIGWFVS